MKMIKSMINSTLAAVVVSFSMMSMAYAVNINTADAQSIADSLNGVGLKKAEAIVAWRGSNGAFKSQDDLTNVRGIGVKTVEKNKDDIQL
jgi:competence protein ComEA